MIYKGEVDIKYHPRPSKNSNMGIYKDPILDHSKGNDKGKGHDYQKATYTYDNVVGTIHESNNNIHVVTIVGKNPKCNVTT